jgi:hypothetical protein
MYILYIYICQTSQNALKGAFYFKQEGLIESTQIRWFLKQSGGGGWWRWPEALKSKLTQGGPSGSSPPRSDGSRDGQTRGWNS